MIQTFEIDRGKVFVAGLFWHPVSAVVKVQKQQIRTLAAEQKSDLCIVRTTGVPQVGLGASADGVKPGMYSAAAVVSKTIEVEASERDFICATEVSNGRWFYVAARDGVMLPDADMVGPEDAIRARMLQDFSIGNWGMIIAPSHWGISNAKERSFATFLPSKKNKLKYHKWWALKPVASKPFNFLPPLAIVVSLAVIAGVGLDYWKKKQAAERAAAEALANQKPPPPPPWHTTPKASVVVDQCMLAIDRLTTLWPGNWDPQSISCAKGNLTVTWKRAENGAVDHLLMLGKGVSVAEDGNSAAQVIPFDVMPGAIEDVPPRLQRLMEMHSAAQQRGIPLIIGAEKAAPILPGMAPNAPGLMPWAEIRWSIKGVGLTPNSIVGILDGPGFRVDSIQASISKGLLKWSLEGTQYATQ